MSLEFRSHSDEMYRIHRELGDLRERLAQESLHHAAQVRVLVGTRLTGPPVAFANGCRSACEFVLGKLAFAEPEHGLGRLADDIREECGIVEGDPSTNDSSEKGFIGTALYYADEIERIFRGSHSFQSR